MGKARRNRSLEFVCARKVLTAVANMCTALNTEEEAKTILNRLREELAALLTGDLSSEAWRQATVDLSGLDAYALQRIGLWPETEENTKKEVENG